MPNGEEQHGQRYRDLLLIFLLVFAAVVFLLCKNSEDQADLLLITVDGEERIREPLKNGAVYEITSADGGTNRIIVEEDEEGNLGIRCTYSNCPEQICVEQGLITLTDQPIVCLPHLMTARILPKDADE